MKKQAGLETSGHRALFIILAAESNGLILNLKTTPAISDAILHKQVFPIVRLVTPLAA